MKNIPFYDRLLLLCTALLAAYQVVVGIEAFPLLAVVSFTVAFGVLLLASLLLIILGFEVLASAGVLIASTLMPLGISLGLVSLYLPELSVVYLLFCVIGLLAVIVTRTWAFKAAALPVFAGVHGVAGVIIFGLPLWMSFGGETPLGFVFVGVGGGLIGLGGLLLALLKAGKPLLSEALILRLLPALLFLMTLAYVIGFRMIS